MSTDLSADARLPMYMTRFVGRGRELAHLRQLVGADSVRDGAAAPARLVTLTGAGGSGKTRLAAQIAHSLSGADTDDTTRFHDGVRWVDLAPITEAEEVPRAIARALGLREAAGGSPMQALITALRERHLLLVIDNCEHLAQACAQVVAALLVDCPRVVLLLTSRWSLQVPDETVLVVPPLETGSAEEVAGGVVPGTGEAIELFLDRAALGAPYPVATEATAGAVAAICQRLGGSPLAIELAASWMRVLTATDLLAEIDRSLDFLSSSTPTLAARHRNLRAVLDASWHRLDEHDRHVLSTLAVFQGSFSREAAEMVCGATLSSLSALTDTYLIQRLPDSQDETRYRIHELVRQFAFERLEQTDGATAETSRAQHLDYFLTLVERAEAAWDTAQEAEWLERLRTERANVDAALRWAMAAQQTEKALRISAGLFSFWVYTTPLALYATTLEQALSLPWDARSSAVTRARAKALNVAGYAAVIASDFDRARILFDEGLTLYAALTADGARAWALRGRSMASRLSGDVQAARADLEHSLAICRAIDDVSGRAWSVHDLGETAFASGDLDTAEKLLEQGLHRFDEHGVEFGAYRALIMLGDVQRRRDQWLAAIYRYQQALDRQRRMHFVAMGGDILEGLAHVAVGLHAPTAGARLFGAGHAWRETYGFQRYAFHEAAHERSITAAKQLLGSAWAASYAAGRDLSSQQAMDEADSQACELASRWTAGHAAGLTTRELEVLHAVALGLGNPEIAARLVVSPRTVHAHLRSIFRKLDVRTRTAAVHEASRLHLV
jgi:non-specific serine/threonine protein kinase